MLNWLSQWFTVEQLNQFLARAFAAIVVAIILELVTLWINWWLARQLQPALRWREGRNREWHNIRRARLLKCPQYIVRVSLALLALLIALQIFGLPLLPVVAWIIIIVIVIGLLLRSPIDNAVACYMLMLDDAINVGDRVRINSKWMIVERIGWFTTHLRDDDGAAYILTNSSLKQIVRTRDTQHKDRGSGIK